jgi:NitT/TauT family transport system permease protein
VTTSPTQVPQRSLVARLSDKRDAIGWPLLGFVIVMVVWQGLVSAGVLSEFVMPAPVDVFSTFFRQVVDPDIWDNAAFTIGNTLAGFVLGAGAGFLIAVLSGLWIPFRKMVYPYMVALQVTPRIALAPIFVAWLGFGAAPKIAVATVICFFVVFINTLAGLESVDRNASEMFRSLGATRAETLRKLELPAALPVAFAGIKTAMTLALVGAIVAEFISSQEGLGLLMQRYAFQLAIPAVFSTLLILMFIGLALFGVMELADRSLVFWRHDARMSKRTDRAAAKAKDDDTISHDPSNRRGPGDNGALATTGTNQERDDA